VSGSPNGADVLVRKLVELLQHVEKFPVLLHESPGSRHGLAVLSKQLRFQLQRHPSEDTLLDLSGRTFKMESLASVRTLEKYLYRKVAKQWYEQHRSQYAYVQHLLAGYQPTFAHTADFDEQGLMYWLGASFSHSPLATSLHSMHAAQRRVDALHWLRTVLD
jgi:E3 ubiquitin-protein ligase HECTD1